MARYRKQKLVFDRCNLIIIFKNSLHRLHDRLITNEPLTGSAKTHTKSMKPKKPYRKDRCILFESINDKQRR